MFEIAWKRIPHVQNEKHQTDYRVNDISTVKGSCTRLLIKHQNPFTLKSRHVFVLYFLSGDANREAPDSLCEP